VARTSFSSDDNKREYVFRGRGLRKPVRKNTELVNATPIIRRLHEGRQTVLHKSGEEFSEGERKRLALLRAIVSNPNLIILDEPTAGLDPSNQEVTWNIIEVRRRDVTRADWGVVMKNGVIMESGNPRELLNRSSLFKEMLIK